MPGCGKSLSAKAIATMFKIPLLRLDLGSIMGKYLGQSEAQLRGALTLAENASPCVLWVDEIEKAFAGVSGDESGVTQRLFGYLLTWLNDKTATVFVVATANDIAVLPPEFMRRGRFDEIFYVDFPSKEERKAILTIHLGKALKRHSAFNSDEFFANNAAGLDDLAKDENTKGYAGSDLASLVNDAMETAWNQFKNSGKDYLQMLGDSLIPTLKMQIKYIKPLEKVLEEKIKRNREKFGEYMLTKASFNEQSFDFDSHSADPEARKRVAADSRCPPKYLERLADDSESGVLIALLKNPACPVGIKSKLMEHQNEDVKAAALDLFMRSDAGIIETAKNGTKEQKLKLAALPTLPFDALEALVGDSDIKVTVSVLEYKGGLPSGILDQLVKEAERCDNVREKVLAHPNCPEEVKRKLEKRCEYCKHYYKHYGYDFCRNYGGPCKNVCTLFECR